jgi:hypothetical protein
LNYPDCCNYCYSKYCSNFNTKCGDETNFHENCFIERSECKNCIKNEPKMKKSKRSKSTINLQSSRKKSPHGGRRRCSGDNGKKKLKKSIAQTNKMAENPSIHQKLRNVFKSCDVPFIPNNFYSNSRTYNVTGAVQQSLSSNCVGNSNENKHY